MDKVTIIITDGMTDAFIEHLRNSKAGSVKEDWRWFDEMIQEVENGRGKDWAETTQSEFKGFIETLISEAIC